MGHGGADFAPSFCFEPLAGESWCLGSAVFRAAAARAASAARNWRDAAVVGFDWIGVNSAECWFHQSLRKSCRTESDLNTQKISGGASRDRIW
jgi:hypothetical protein